MTSERGVLLVLSGPSGVGKDTLLDAWIASNPRVRRVITYTTRPPRPNEENGVDYHFVTEERFHQLADAGHFFEHKSVHGNWYASPKTDALEFVAQGYIAVLKIDVQGALDVAQDFPEAVLVFILPPSGEELERRIRNRGVGDEDEVLRRLANAHGEISKADRYHFRIVNDEIDRAVSELESAVASVAQLPRDARGRWAGRPDSDPG
ncbi:MAG: guanylate kinase [Fimbriimonadaceae bacterium]|uniref:Guanylate kinase n=1 Tax=Candidatus Nitrosymbiomonas proteolyticus TaxID=2608984 RepID=A0A809RGA2_9BACT|nr:guanylate kinase [Fimbriimonadaceae bacterium]NUM38829.1 guanylate kinase [Armatimonadota bacterium]BBO23495.1 guanylate kinase [Candidatus Nitrosymbiomonas proteolyticus]HQU19605.1 guanylate kinase [Fimbriimonadaceae bacterium]